MGFFADLIGAMKETPKKSLSVEECITDLGWTVEEKDGETIRFRPTGCERRLSVIVVKPFVCFSYASTEMIQGVAPVEILLRIATKNAVCAWKCVDVNGVTAFALYAYTHIAGVNPESMRCFCRVMLDEMQEFEAFIKQVNESGQTKAA